MINTRKHILLSALLINLSILLCNSSLLAQTFDVQLPEKAEKLSRKKRMRKTNKKEKNKQKKIRTYLDMEYDQLVQAKEAQKASGNITATIKYLEQLLKITSDISLLAQHLLELADALFEDKQFKKSAFVYNQYCTLYPGSEKQEYALYRSIISSFECILSRDRDQSKTEETLALTEIFLQQDLFQTYRDEVRTIQTRCYEQLAASECNVCSFYLQKGSLKAAEKRLTKIRTFWLPKLPTLEPEIIALETQLIDKKELMEATIHKNTELAQNTKKKHMVNRF